MDNNFGEIFDSLNKTYSDLEMVLGQLYDDAQKDEEKREIFNKVANVAKDVLLSQMKFADSYADKNMKEYCDKIISQKEELINKTIEEVNGVSYK